MKRLSVLEDQLLLSTLSWREIEDVYLMFSEPPKRRFKSERGFLDVDSLDDHIFRSLFRFHKEDIGELLSCLRIPDKVTSAQGVVVAGEEALCITLRRLAYPNRWVDLEMLFGRSSSTLSSIATKVLRHIDTTFSHLLQDLNVHSWLDLAELERMSQAVHAKGAPLTNCWGFLDGTARAICRPSQSQTEYFSGHKRHHVIKFQSVMCANGIICELDGPYRGRRHDAGMLQRSCLYEKLQRLVQGRSYVLYGDPAYPIKALIIKPYGVSGATAPQQLFNSRMSTVRQAVEWGFGKIVAEFAFVDFKKNQKILRQRVARMYKVATILANCHTCTYGSQVASFFDLAPPTLQEYLSSGLTPV
ncbi:uncharacterized protein ISCGN_025280 [Ixodes scapularis]